jgi:hypothetical protein
VFESSPAAETRAARTSVRGNKILSTIHHSDTKIWPCFSEKNEHLDDGALELLVTLMVNFRGIVFPAFKQLN